MPARRDDLGPREPAGRDDLGPLERLLGATTGYAQPPLMEATLTTESRDPNQLIRVVLKLEHGF